MNVFKKKDEASGSPVPERLQYRVKEASVLLGISQRKLDTLIAVKQIPSYKIGGCRFICAEALKSFVKAQAKGGTDGQAA